ncbi:MAG TPA: hypothetical protein VN372_15610 [Methanospirillum sp.]|nr:hypothetical protein [Methanospirillum sp.]
MLRKKILLKVIFLSLLAGAVGAAQAGELILTPMTDQVRQGDSLVVSVQGAADTDYYLWFSQTGLMSGLAGDQPPMVAPGQQQADMDPEAGPYEIGSYLYAGGGGRIIRQDIPYQPAGGVQYYCRITTAANGLATVRFETSPSTWAGRYTLHAERKVNGSVVTADATIRIIERGIDVRLTLEKNKVIQGQYISATITGVPDSPYYLWFRDTSLMTGLFGDQPPIFVDGQSGITHDPPRGPYLIGSYQYENGAGRSIHADVPAAPSNGTIYYGLVRTDKTGVAKIKLITSSETRPGQYTLQAEWNKPGAIKTATAAIMVERQAAVSFSLTLSPGWNYISSPKALSDGNNTMAIFDRVDTAGHSIWNYDASSLFTSRWRALEREDGIVPLSGYWIYSARPVVVPLRFKIDPGQGIPHKQLWYGWNAIGFTETVPYKTLEALSSVKDAWIYTFGYDAASQRYLQTIINGGSGPYSDQRLLEPGQGYWVYVSQDAVLSGLSR